MVNSKHLSGVEILLDGGSRLVILSIHCNVLGDYKTTFTMHFKNGALLSFELPNDKTVELGEFLSKLPVKNEEEE